MGINGKLLYIFKLIEVWKILKLYDNLLIVRFAFDKTLEVH